MAENPDEMVAVPVPGGGTLQVPRQWADSITFVDWPEPDPPAPANVLQALARVMAELPGIGKDAESPQGYKYRGIESITRHAQELFGKYGVVFVPRIDARTTIALTIGGKPWTEEQLSITYRVFGPGGVEDFIDVGPLLGFGRDNSDKGANKAMTQAFKYALLQVLCIGDGKDDADAHPANAADAKQDEWANIGWANQAEHDAERERLFGRLRSLSKDQQSEFRVWREQQDLTFQQALTRDEMAVLHAGAERLQQGERLTPGEAVSGPERPEQPATTDDAQREGNATEGNATEAKPERVLPPVPDQSQPEACAACVIPDGEVDPFCGFCEGTGTIPPTPNAPEACDLCGSTRAALAVVDGVTRCQNATDCRKRTEKAQEGE